MARHKGVALPDYALTLGLVTLVGAVALSLSGNTIRDFYNNAAEQFSLPGMEKPGIEKPDAANNNQNGNPENTSGGQNAQTNAETGKADGDIKAKPYPTKEISLRLPDGRVIAVTDYPENMVTAVETAGADGTTKSLASFMSVMAEKLKAAGQINDKQYQSLIDLSNQGFKIGELQSKVQSAYASSDGTDAAYLDKLKALGLNARPSGEPSPLIEELHPIVVDDLYIARPVREFVELNTYGHINATQSMSDAALAAGVNETNPNLAPSATSKLIYYLELAKRSGALDNPAANNIVQYATRDIVRLANASGNALNNQEVAKNIQSTRDNSSTICNVGGGSASSGVQCDN